MLTRENILAKNDTEIRKVKVPEWGGEVCVRVLTGVQRDAFESAVAGKKKDGLQDIKGLRSMLVALALCDDKGTQLFSEADAPVLEKKSSKALQRIFDAAAELNGILPASMEEARADFTPDRNQESGTE